MMSIINELWRGNISPQTDSRNNSPEMKELIIAIDACTVHSGEINCIVFD